MEGNAEDPTCAGQIRALAAQQVASYCEQPVELISHFNHETNVSMVYRGRQILELLQNADDAGEEFDGERNLLVRVTDSRLLVANSGQPFSAEGIQSLIVSDFSPKLLSRQRYIGNKGLGFRSVLTWTDRPIVLSGSFTVGFSRQWATEQTLRLAESLSELADRLRQWQEERAGLVPAPVMRFPFVPPEDDPSVQAGRALQEKGYDTVVVLPLPEGDRRARVHKEIVEQTCEISPEILLFCQNIESLEIDGPRRACWTVAREHHDSETRVVLDDGDAERVWRVRRERGSLPPRLIEQDLRETPHFEVAVATPRSLKSDGQGHRLNVFFPTSHRIPMRMIAHATLATDDGRKHVIDHAANRYVLAYLAGLLARTAAEEAQGDDPCRGLQLLEGVERCDEELRDLGFVDALISVCADEALFPTAGGVLGRSRDVLRPPHAVWYRVAGPPAFSEMLVFAAEERAGSLLDEFELSWLPPEEIGSRLRVHLGGLGPHEAGALVGGLISERVLPKEPPLPLLLTTNGTFAPSEQRVFLPSTGREASLPPWVSDMAFLEVGFMEGLQEALDTRSVRGIRSRLEGVGYAVEEYRFEAVARFLAQEVAQAKNGREESSLWRDVLACLYEFGIQGDDVDASRAPVQVVTLGGIVRRAAECYLGPEYPGAGTVDRLYAEVDLSLLVAGPEQLGLHAPPKEVELFLGRLGVANRPRPVMFGPSEGRGYFADFVAWTLDRLEYPTTFFGSPPRTRREVELEFEITFDGLTVPDRWSAILEHAEAEAVIAYLLTRGFQHLRDARVEGAVLTATTGRERIPRPYPAVPVPDPAQFLLRTRPWVLCNDGEKHCPNRIILTSYGKRALDATFFTHALRNDNPVLSEAGTKNPVETVLKALGAVHSLEDLAADDLYRLLLGLPEFDQDGADAASIYRSLVEGRSVDVDSPLRARFVENGKMWGTRKGSARYYPVKDLRYAARSSIPKPVRDEVPLVAIDPRRSGKEVERIFGIRPLGPDDFRVELDPQQTKYQLWSEEAHLRVRSCVPYLYALRLSKTGDETSRERSALRDIRLGICRQIGIEVSLEDGPSRPVSLAGNMEGLLLREQALALLTSTSEHVPRSPAFWLAVANLLADAIGVASAAPDFAQLLGCETEGERFELLGLMTDGQAEVQLSLSRARLQLKDEEPPSREFDLPEVESLDKGDEEDGGSAESPGEEPVSPGPAPGTTGPFEPTEPPKGRPPGRRRIVVSRRSKKEGKPTGPRCTEEVSLPLVEEFERQQGRHPIRVEHLHGAESFGCDLISVATERAAQNALSRHSIRSEEIQRFIEVKGRSDRTGSVGLSDNQRAAAERYRDRFFLYRVYRDHRSGGFELAVLAAPIGSPGERVRTAYEYDLGADSGADWFRVSTRPGGGAEHAEDASAPTGTTE